ncbi:MAG: hypothetical protein K2M16_08750 [Muribaculaceae bacterium]|nr:hypothetical protein [Muribaculaceae bacterium]
MTKDSLTDKVLRMLECADRDPSVPGKIFGLIKEAPENGERDGLMALALHEGIGVPVDLDRSFRFAEKAAFKGGDALGYYILGYMCDKAETPDQAEGGPRQKYDHYDAERFYEKCAEKESHWKNYACNWLGDYFLNMARGGDPEIGIEYLEKIADYDAEAAGKLSDYYWDIVMPDGIADSESAEALFRWTERAVRLDEGDEEYVYRMGWLYADGIGCGKSFWLALKYFGEAFYAGDWRGAESIANLLEEELNREDHGLTPEELKEFHADIKKWRKRAAAMKEESDAEEPDNAVEED